MSKFPKKSPGDSLGHDHVNDLGDDVTRLTSGMPTGGNVSSFRSTFHGTAALPAHVEGFAQVLEVEIDDEDTENSGLYLVSFRNFDVDLGVWVMEEDARHVLDARCFCQNYVPGRSLTLQINDVLTIRYCPQRGALVPVDPPLMRRVVASSDIAAGANGDCELVNSIGTPDGRFIEVFNDWATHGKITSGDQLFVTYDRYRDRYIPLKQIATLITDVTDVSLSGVSFLKKTRQVRVIAEAPETGWVSWHDGEECS